MIIKQNFSGSFRYHCMVENLVEKNHLILNMKRFVYLPFEIYCIDLVFLNISFLITWLKRKCYDIYHLVKVIRILFLSLTGSAFKILKGKYIL